MIANARARSMGGVSAAGVRVEMHHDRTGRGRRRNVKGRTVEFTGLQLKTNLETGKTTMINEPHVTDLDSIKRLTG
jgi:hypothetical protein